MYLSTLIRYWFLPKTKQEKAVINEFNRRFNDWSSAYGFQPTGQKPIELMLYEYEESEGRFTPVFDRKYKRLAKRDQYMNSIGPM